MGPREFSAQVMTKENITQTQIHTILMAQHSLTMLLSMFGFSQNPKARHESSSKEVTTYLKHTDKYVSGGRTEVLMFLFLTGREKGPKHSEPKILLAT